MLRCLVGFVLCVFCVCNGFALDVSGIVLDEKTREGLIGASVVVKGNNTKGVAADLEGKFVLTDVADDAVLQISYLGYETQEVKAGVNLNITLKETSIMMQEVSVVACANETLKGLNATKALYHVDKGKCIPIVCIENYILTDENDNEYAFPAGCTENINSDTCVNPNVDVSCVVRKDKETGTEPISEQENIPEDISSAGSEAPEVDSENVNDGMSVAVDTNNAQQESQEKIDELQGKVKSAKDKERSTENKLLGAVGIGATGIGGMMLASGVAEQNADADAENAMRAYLATFTCNYGAGKNVRGGEKNVELPGGNELIELYSEYVNLANDLRARKEALGMMPGIEAEPILDSATSGLYDDVAVGKTGGAYTSLARALADPNSEDAKKWQEQKDESADKKKTGTITAGVGAVGSLVGDLIVNSEDKKKCETGYEWNTDKKECVQKE